MKVRRLYDIGLILLCDPIFCLIIFIVDLNGNVARLESMESPTQIINSAKTEPSMSSDRKRKSDDSVDDLSNQPAPASLDDHEADSSKKDLANLIGESSAQKVLTFLEQQQDEDVIDPLNDKVEKFFILPEISDKETRRSVHMLMKSPAFSSMALADNADGRIRIWQKRYEADMPKDTFSGGRDGDRAKNNSKNNSNGGGRSRDGGAKRAPWPKDRPDFLRFVLYKENIDTTTATKDVVKIAHLNPKSGINYAGMKDKRGVTTQFCSVYRMEKEQLLAVNKDVADSSGGGNTTSQGGSNIIRLGNFHYSKDEVRLGALTGNRFDVVLRNIDVGEDSSTSRKQQIQETLEAAGNSLKAHGFINYFGMQRFGKYYDTHLVGIAVLKGDFERAVKIIMDEKPDEYPPFAEARKKWARRFESIDVTVDEKSAREAEMKCARTIQNVLGRFMNCEKSIVSSLARKPRDYQAAFCSIAKNMRSMFLHAYQSYLWNMVASHRMESGGNTEVRVGDLVQIETGMDCASGGTSGLKGKSVKLITEEDVLNSRYSITDIVIPLAGSKIMYPSGDFFDELLKKDGISKSDFVKIGNVDREIALGGDYRKLICKPDDVSFEIKVYSDPLQPLLQTDLMKVKKIDVAAITLSSSSEDNEMHTQNQAVQEDNQQDDIIFGMNVGFSLPSSSYATIALRELTKRPTSSEYQSKLEVGGGRCERNLGLASMNT